MSDTPMKMLWMGEAVETLHRDVLIEIIRQLHRELESARECTNSIIQVNEMARRARQSRGAR